MRRKLTEVISDRLYDQFMDAIRLHQIEAPLQDCEFMDFKSARATSSRSTTS